MFTKDQIEEIDVLKELCSGVEVNGASIVCFDTLSDIAHGMKDISSISKEDLLLMKKQLRDYKDFWNEADWYDNQNFLELLPRINEIINGKLLKFK